ncbi:MAG: Aspartyl-tRNA synthetase (EC [uncultured Paraburkholderia sp.]|nr:MAG: Aspartyl-tRNA synthetase (EC [uncultured Paraburkholderia sp.]CAH2945530.1 MAG: Aspartyl-tRNA synthetase (EC [uncultured Paraburkholderia sp.]
MNSQATYPTPLNSVETSSNDEVRGWVEEIEHGCVVIVRSASKRIRIDCSAESLQGVFEVLRPEFVIRTRVKCAENVESVDENTLFRACTLEILSRSDVPPFLPRGAFAALPAARARYRYLDFRSDAMQRILRTRHRFVVELSKILDSHGFISVDTPLLATPSTTGAREFRVQGKTTNRSYALPQSAQMYGQLLVAGGVERYYQWSRCFRDEDLRANRQPEFTQLHLEMAFIDGAGLRRLIEKTLIEVSISLGHRVSSPFPVLPYHDAIERFGDDKPDLRYELEMTSFPFSVSVTNRGGSLVQLSWDGRLPTTSDLMTALPSLCEKYGLLCQGYLPKSAFRERFLPRHLALAELKAMPGYSSEPQVDRYPLLYGEHQKVTQLHQDCYRKLRSTEPFSDAGLAFAWVTDFPLFCEVPEQPGRIQTMNSPFVAPSDRDALLGTRKHRDLLRLSSTSFDLVLNGDEIASGSSVIHEPDVQRVVFDALGLSRKELRAAYGYWMDALRFGVPPMTGMGIGLERLLATYLGEAKIRSVMAFPKTKQGYCPVTNEDTFPTS